MAGTQRDKLELKRPRTLHFPLRVVQRINNTDVVRAVSRVTSETNIAAVQFTSSECRITFKNVQAKQAVKADGLDLGGTHVRLLDADLAVTSVMIKDAPVEMEDSVIITKLSQYGTVMQGSMKRGKIRDTEIENGIRYVTLTNLKADTTIPPTCIIGRFEIRLICDQNRSAAKNTTGERRCFRCLSTCPCP